MRIHSGYPPNVTTSLLQPHWLRYPISVSDDPSLHPTLIEEGNTIGQRWLNATVSRSACLYTRLANLYPHGYQQEGQRPVNFSIIETLQPDENSPFSITAKEGILYISHPELLAKSQNLVELWIRWDLISPDSSSPQNGTTLFRIDVVGSIPPSNSFDGCDAGLYCAKFRNEIGCKQAIGSVATDQRGCTWRRNDNNDSLPSSSGPSRMYQTCSPDLSTCPDGYFLLLITIRYFVILFSI